MRLIRLTKHTHTHTHNALAETAQGDQDHAGGNGAGGPRPRSNNARLHETRTKHRQHSGTTTQEHSAAQRDHESSVKIQKAPTFDRDRRPDGGTDGYPQISPPDPSHRGIISRTQLRSLARTHATQTQAQSKSISRFGGSANAALTPPTSDMMIIYADHI